MLVLSAALMHIKAVVFPVVMYGCESRTECQRIDAFELWYWRRLLRVPWTSRRSNQSILKEISPGCSLEGLMLKLNLQYFGHLMRRVDSLEKTLMLGGIGGRRKRRQQRMSGWMVSLAVWHHWLDWHGFGWTLGVGDGQGGLACCNSWGHKELDTTERLNWTELIETESRLVVSQGQSMDKMGVTSNGHGVSSWGWGNVLKLIMITVAQLLIMWLY